MNSEFGTYILYKNNTCKSLEAALSMPMEKHRRQIKNTLNSMSECDLKIYDTNVHKLINGTLILSYFQLNLVNKECEFVIVPIVENDDNLEKSLKIKRYPITDSSEPNGFAAARIVDTTMYGPSLITVRKLKSL